MTPDDDRQRKSVLDFYRAVASATAGSERPTQRTLNFGIQPRGERDTSSGLSSERRSLTQMLQLLLGDPPAEGWGGLLLEVGCGLGGNLVPLERWFTTVGVDLSADILRSGRANRDSTVSQLRVAVGDAQSLPVRSDSVDAVLNLESGGHYPDIDRFFQEVSRVVRPGGHFFYADGIVSGFVEEYRRRLISLGFVEEVFHDITELVLESFDRQWTSSAAAKRFHAGLLCDRTKLAAFMPIMIENAWLKYRLETGLVRYVALRARRTHEEADRDSVDSARSMDVAVRELQPLLDVTTASLAL